MVRKHNIDIHDPETQRILERPYSCDLCSTALFTTASTLVDHYHETHAHNEVPEILLNQAKAEAIPLSVANLQDDALSCMSEMSDGKTSSSIQDLYDDIDDDDDADADDENAENYTDEKRPSTSTPLSVSLDLATRLTPLDDLSPADSPTSQIRMPESPAVELITDCWKCGKAFDTRRYLLKHLKEHNIDTPFKCILCDATFAVRRESLEHVAAAHPTEWDGLKEKNNVLTISTFSDFLERIVSQRIEEIRAKFGGNLPEENGVKEADYIHRKVYCTFCPKRFCSLQDLRRHGRSHTGERPFKCDICHQRFTLKHCMVRHRRTHDSAAVNMAAEKTSTTPPAAPVSPDSAIGTDQSASGLLNSLLGVEDSQLNQMLDSAHDAAQMLGMK